MCVKAVLAVADLGRKDVNLDLIKARPRQRYHVACGAAGALKGLGSDSLQGGLAESLQDCTALAHSSPLQFFKGHGSHRFAVANEM